jgi:hypothetical protein
MISRENLQPSKQLTVSGGEKKPNDELIEWRSLRYGTLIIIFLSLKRIKKVQNCEMLA